MKKNYKSMSEAMTRALSELGYSLIDAGEFEEALEMSRDLEKAGIYSAFEVAAAAYAGMGDLKHAIATLERGVKEDPDYWINWELLGSYRSESGDFAGADCAYLKGLQCRGAWVDSITYNRAVAKARSGDAHTALEILEDVIDPALDEPAAMVRIGLLVELGRAGDALQFVNQCLAGEWRGRDAQQVLSRFRQKKGWLLQYIRETGDEGGEHGDGNPGACADP